MTAKPAIFDAEHAPVGVEVRFVEFVASRPKITPRSIFVHTNGATGEGSIDSAWNWAHVKPQSNTCPHYQVDRAHDGVLRARKMLPSDRKGIANATVDAYQEGRGDIAMWSLAIETADLGWPTPGGACGFEAQQGEMVAQILAYESIVHGFPLVKLPEWHGSGVAAHTDPFGYPYTTLYPGKPCPGEQKKADLWAWLLPRAIQIRAEWTQPAPTPPPPVSEEDDMAYTLRITDNGTAPTDIAVFTVSGVLATWQRDGNAEAALEDADLVAGDKLVRRAGLKGLTLIGPAPDDDNFAAYRGAPADKPGRTRGSDFGARLR